MSAKTNHNDPFNLNRFLIAQANVYDEAFSELESGRKSTHWMWFIFPQIDGLGNSSTSKFYAIKSVEEAKQYLSHPTLGARLIECTEAVLSVQERSASEIFGYPDDRKLKSSMTLFESISAPNSVFESVLKKYFDGEKDGRTIKILGSLKKKLK